MNADSGVDLTSLTVDGGMVHNELLMQFQADVLGVPVQRPAVLEVTAYGAAALAGLGTGFFRDRASIPSTGGALTTFEPGMDAGRREALYAGWKRAVERAQRWEE